MSTSLQLLLWITPG